ncbi:hypothetical protein Bhyg_14966 [Pseudolycoriella hygida]|uniref:Uncharacterized protein n=1 Tax=Pseudolycoriella hygida TaxID=35572 RepID=A0A9Q0MQY0_9DIPT|nr:hypothetical protein Bhyg_14966 [Pseudolycoriella hygida]
MDRLSGTVTRICFGSSVKGYSTNASDNDIICFEKLEPAEYVREFVLGIPRTNIHKADDTIISTELIGLRGIVTGKYSYLALHQCQILDSSLKRLVVELSSEYWDRVYNIVRRTTINPKLIQGKNALQQLYQYQMARYIRQNKKPPNFQLKMPDCFEITGSQHCQELFHKFLNLRNEKLSTELVDLLWLEKQEKIDELPHDDDVFYEKIVNFVLGKNN